MIRNSNFYQISSSPCILLPYRSSINKKNGRKIGNVPKLHAPLYCCQQSFQNCFRKYSNCKSGGQQDPTIYKNTHIYRCTWLLIRFLLLEPTESYADVDSRLGKITRCLFEPALRGPPRSLNQKWAPSYGVRLTLRPSYWKKNELGKQTSLT